jgi:hypothetical protein
MEMKAPEFPVKQIVKIIAEETKSKLEKPFGDEELREMFYDHVARIGELDSYEAIDSWLVKFRRTSLTEWVESL